MTTHQDEEFRKRQREASESETERAGHAERPIGDVVGDLMESVWHEKFRKQRVAAKSDLADRLADWSETWNLPCFGPVTMAFLAEMSQMAYESRKKIPAEEEALRGDIETYIEALDLVVWVNLRHQKLVIHRMSELLKKVENQQSEKNLENLESEEKD